MNETGSFGYWLTSARKRRRLSQEGLARAAGINRSYISQIEQGRVQLPKTETRAKLHDALGTNEEDLISAGVMARDEYGIEYAPKPSRKPVAGGGRLPIARPRHDAPMEQKKAYLHVLIANLELSEEQWRELVQIAEQLLEEERVDIAT